MATIKDSIRAAFIKAENRWMFTGEIASYSPEIKLTSMYSVLSQMSAKQEVERNEVAGGNEYRLPEAVYVQLRADKLAERGEPGFVPKMELSENACVEVEVQTVPEGMKGRKRHVIWDQEDRECFALLYARQHRELPGASFSVLAHSAMQYMEPAKKKSALIKSQLAWFDVEFEKAKRVMHEEDKAAARAAEQRAHEVQAQRAAQTFKEVAQSMPNDIFMAELMRRGTALVESALIQALTSPRVREALSAAVGADRRFVQRHDPSHGQTANRPALKKILIFGLNKPNHQNEIRNTFSEMFDLRFLSVRPNPGQLKAMVRPVDLVIVMKDHVNHSSVDEIKSEGVPFKRLDGGVGNCRAYLYELHNNPKIEEEAAA